MPDGSLVVTGYRDAVWLRSRPSSEWRGVGANYRPEVGAEGKAPACVLVTSGQGLGDRMKVRWIVPLKLMSKLLQPIQFYPTSLPIIMMKLLFDCDMYCLMICAVSIMIPSIVAGSVVTLFGSAPGSDDVIILYTSALYITLILL